MTTPIPTAEFLIEWTSGQATVLCTQHTQAMQATAQAAGLPITIYEIAPEDRDITCQACHLAQWSEPLIVPVH